jgi:hypothetical protein
MKHIVCLWLLAMGTIAVFAQQKTHKTIIKNAGIIDVSSGKLIPNKTIIIANGIIEDIVKGNSKTINQHANIIDGKGMFLMPGLSEMHAHLPAKEVFANFLENQIKFGITQVRIMNTEGAILDDKNTINTMYTHKAPSIFYPFLFTNEMLYTEVQMDSLVKEVKRNGYDFIKLLSVKNREIFTLLMHYANANNILVCGHYPSMIPIQELLLSGFRSIEHLAGYDKLDSTALQQALARTKTNNVFHCPTLDYFSIALFLEQPKEVYKKRFSWNYASDKERYYWDTTYIGLEKTSTINGIQEYQQKGKAIYEKKIALFKKLYAANTTLLLGSDPGSLYQLPGANILDEAIKWKQAGIANATILKAATINAAAFFKQEKQWGLIKKGYKANLILLSKNPLENIEHLQTVNTTIVNGIIVYQK